MNTFIKSLLISLILCSLTACMSVGNVNYRQAKVLKKEGFSLTEEGWSLGLPEQLLFGLDSSNIRSEQFYNLTQLSKVLLKYDLNKLKVIGHTDNLGSESYNQRLSEKRAETVKAVFLRNGFDSKNITSVGRGSTQPIVDNNSESNRAKNRRVNIVIIP